jgi:N-methylhydantoinase A
MQLLGIDVGGTFTDLVLYDEASGGVRLAKVTSTPADQSAGMIAGIERLGLDLAQVAKLAHGSTVATNTALERNGAVTAILTTKGFRDVVEVGRGNRIDLYDIKAVRPRPLVPRSLVFEVDERTLHDGSVLRRLDAAGVRRAVAVMKARGVSAVAVCFLHAYANPANEQQAKALIGKLAPSMLVSTSAEVLPEYREYERFATTVLNAYVAPRVSRYLGGLRRKLKSRGFTRPVAIMTSNGGTASAEWLARHPIHSMLSGPAAGVIGAVHVGRGAGEPNLITCDMGGTSTDVCLIRGLDYALTSEGAIGAMPNRVPHVEINSIGAGGGSIAWLGAGGFLSVGPRSAGAVPGPACYGRGGREPTVTDANVVLGRLDTGKPLGGDLKLDPALAQAAVGRLAEQLGVAPLAMAQGIVTIANTKMTAAIKEITIMRGIDPRDFALMMYGGAGPLHGAAIAEELGIRRVLVPPMPGNFSAFGLLVADIRHDFARSRVIPTRDLPFAELAATFAALEAEGRATLAREGVAEADMRFERRLDMRFIGQAFELSVPVPDDAADMAAIDRAFQRVYAERYAHAVSDPVEIVTFRLTALGGVPKPRLPRPNGVAPSAAAAQVGTRPMVFADGFVETPIYARDKLPPDEPVIGPAAVEESGTTTIIPPGGVGFADAHGNLILERRP